MLADFLGFSNHKIGKNQKQRMPESIDEQRTDEEKHSESSTSVTSSNNTVSTYHPQKTREDRQLLHPLELNDKLAFETIKTSPDFAAKASEARFS